MTESRSIDYQQLHAWRRSHPAWRLLLADHAPMIASFLHQSFVVTNARGIARERLAAQLDDHLFRLHEAIGEKLYPKAGTAYLDDWASDARGWLRKYYPSGLDEPHYDLTPAAELALRWMGQLEPRAFIGTEARLAGLQRTLQEIADGTELSPRVRIAQLQQRKAEIDAEIARIEHGHLELMEPGQVREHFLLALDTAQALLSDLRAVEQSFRAAGQAFHEGLAAHQGPLTGTPFEGDAIGATDEGASFTAFRKMLVSPGSRAELAGLLDKAATLETVRALDPEQRLRRQLYQLAEASGTTEDTGARISRQLRRQTEERARLENRRLMQLMRGIEQKALALRERAPDGPFMEVDEPAPSLALPMARTLFNPPFKPRIRHRPLDDSLDAQVPSAALFETAPLDPLRLASNVRRALEQRAQVTLAEVASIFPVRHGVAELAAYLELGAHDFNCAIDEERTEVVYWTDGDGKARQATLPAVIYTR